MHTHVVIEARYSIGGPYAVQGASRLGSAVDQGVERGPDGWPLVPASSWRGRVRAHLESLLRGLGVPVCHPPDPARTCPHDPEVLAQLQLHGRRFCPVCELFGSAWRPSRIAFTDLTHPGREGEAPVTERVNVAINRVLGTVEEQRLFSYETAGFGSDAFTRVLTGQVWGVMDRSQVGLLVLGLRLPTHLGGKKARGLGLILGADVQVNLRSGSAGPAEPVGTAELNSWVDDALAEVRTLATAPAV